MAVTASDSQQGSRYTGPSSFPPSCTVQRPGFSIGSRSGCLCSTLGIKWQDHVSNEEVLKRASLPRIKSILLQVQLCWTGHITRMEDVRMSKAVFFSNLRCSKKALQRSAEETACTGGNQPSVMAAGGLRWRKLALFSEKSQL